MKTRVLVLAMLTAVALPLSPSLAGQAAPAPAPAASAAPEVDFDQLSHLGTILYITAHPDDESAAVISYLARGLHARVVILCLTHGSGGQDVVSPALDQQLGEIRTRELEQAARGYGAEVRWGGALDFGYSKSVEETFKVWDENAILREMVRDIRELRPLAVIARWTGTDEDPGGSHHQASGILARKAFALAGDASAFPDLAAAGLAPWQPRYFLVHVFHPEDNLTFEVPVQQPSPTPGKTFEQLGWDAFQAHRSQGIHLYKLPPGRHYYLRVEATLKNGPPPPTSAAELSRNLNALPDLFPRVPALGAWRERLKQVVELVEKARGLDEAGKSAESALTLVQGAALLGALAGDLAAATGDAETRSAQALVAARQQQLLAAALTETGSKFEALTDRAGVTPGEKVWVRLALRLGSPAAFQAAGFKFGALRLNIPTGWAVEPLSAETTAAEQRSEYQVTVPEHLDPPRAPLTPLTADALLSNGSQELRLSSPVRGLGGVEWVSPPGLLERIDPRRLLHLGGAETKGSGATVAELEPVRVVPAVTLSVEPPLSLLAVGPTETAREWCIDLQAHRPDVGPVSAWFRVPMGWYTPLPAQATLTRPDDNARLCLDLTLPANIKPGRYAIEAVAGHGGETYDLGRTLRLGPSSEPPYVLEPQGVALEALDVQVPAGLRIGWIGFDSDPEAALLSRLGITVDLLDDQALKRARLADYDAIVVANRAYDYRNDLPEQNARLLDYVKAGGTLVLEHQGRNWDPAKFAPYPGTKPADNILRVTDETAAVKILAPANPVFNFPNTIGPDDWQGWVQERGLFFWESWAPNYTPLVEMADPGEAPQQGALLYARYGEGTYIYCGLALFRQVRHGVPGGIRLYVNLLSQGRVPKAAPAAP